MRKLVKLQKDENIIYNAQIGKFLDPNYIFLEIKKNYHSLVKKDDKVLLNSIVIENKLNKVLSSVSGKVIGFSKGNVDGKLKNLLVIQNDFKEKEKTSSRKITKYQKENIVSKLYEFYYKYIASILESKKINNLVISGVDDEPYILNNIYIMKEYHKEILEISDILSKTFEINNVVIAIKNINSKTIETYVSKLGTYPNINLNLIPDKYLIGNSYFLMEYLNLKEQDTLVIDAKTILGIYYALKYNKHFNNVFITISGTSINKSMVLEVKEGTLFKEIIDNKIKLKNEDNLYILNGLMTGIKCDINNTIVTKNTIGLIIIPNKEYPEGKCNNCGLCYKICPVKVNPKKVMDTGIKSSNCINCGLCSYICPCYVNLRKFLEGNNE